MNQRGVFYLMLALSLLLFSGQAHSQSAPVVSIPFGPGGSRIDLKSMTPLMRAVAEGNTAQCRTLLQHGADVNVADRYGVTPLMEAVVGGPILMPNGSYGGFMPFPMDVRSQRTSLSNVPKSRPAPALLPMLLANGARVNAQDINGRTALWWAVRLGDTSKATLLAHHADPNLACTKPVPEEAEADQVTPLLLAVGMNQMDMTRLLLAHGADPNARSLQDPHVRDAIGLTPVSFALTDDALPMLRLLLSHGGDANAADPDPEKRTLLMKAVNAKQTQAVIELLAHHANVNAQDAQGKTALMYAVSSGSRPCLEAVLSRRPKLEMTDKDGSTALRDALGDATLVEELLNAGAEADGAPGQGDFHTPLWTACVEGNIATAHVLIAHGANVNAMDKFGMTVLMRTAEYGRTDCVKLLLDSGANIAARDQNGSTALIWAVATDDAAPVIAVLLSRGVVVDAADKFGNTALRLAAANGYVHAMQAVLPFEPTASLTGDIGKSALQWAVKNHHPDAAQILKGAGATE